VILFASSGQLIVTFFGQSDIPLFVVLCLGLFASLLHERKVVFLVLMLTSCWLRPEGIVLSGTLVVSAFILCRTDQRSQIFLVAAGILGIISFGLMLLLNYQLTGYTKFTSIVEKGLFAEHPFQLALLQTIETFGGFLSEVFLNLSDPPRMFYTFPVFGGILALVGIITRPWKKGSTRQLEAWWILAALGNLAVITNRVGGACGSPLSHHRTCSSHPAISDGL
jgi:hypothetical protein